MNFKTQRVANLLVGIFLTIFGAYFIYLCANDTNRIVWNIINAEAYMRTPQHPTSEDLGQLVLLAICGLGSIITGASHFWYLFKNADKKQ